MERDFYVMVNVFPHLSRWRYIYLVTSVLWNAISIINNARIADVVKMASIIESTLNRRQACILSHYTDHNNL